MKDPTLAIISLLKADAAVAAKVSARIYRASLPKEPTYPCIAVVRVTKTTDEITNSSRYISARVQCTTFASSDYEAEEISDLILDALEDVQNTVVNGMEIGSIDDAGSVPDNSDGLTMGVWRDNHDFMIDYRNR